MSLRATLQAAQANGRDAQPADRQRVFGDLHSPARLAQHVLGADRDVVQEERVLDAAPHAHRQRFRPDPQSRASLPDDETGQAAWPAPVVDLAGEDADHPGP